MKTHFNTRLLLACVLLLLLMPVTLLTAQVTFADECNPCVGTFFFGTVNSLPPSGLIGTWKVNNVTVQVTDSTIINQDRGAVGIGALVGVQGWSQPDGSIKATMIDVVTGVGGTVKFFGLVKTLPGTTDLVGDWTVLIPVTQTVTVHVTSATKIDQTKGKVAVGAIVKVEGKLETDDSVDASAITVVFLPPGPGKPFEFFGQIDSLPSSGLIGDWSVSGIQVHVSSTTNVDQSRAKAEVGAFVRVVGILQSDGSVNATYIEVRAKPTPPPAYRYVKFFGTVQSLPTSSTVGAWVVSGLTVNVTAQTQIMGGTAKVGSTVVVKGLLQTDGTINAIRIEVIGTGGNTNSPFGQSSAFAPVGP